MSTEDNTPNDTERTERTDSADGAEEMESRMSTRRLQRYLRLGAVAVLSVLALIATFQLYGNAARAVSLWVSPAYEPLFQAGFNLVVVLVTVSAVAVLLSRLGER